MKMVSRYFVERRTCPACRSQSQHPIYRSGYTDSPLVEYLESFYRPYGGIELVYLDGAYYSLVECPTCGLIYQDEIPNEQLMERLYEKWIDPELTLKRRTEEDSLMFYSYYAQEIMQILAYLDKNPGELNIFDFGMGWGKWARMAKAFGCNACGLEMSKQRIDYAKSNGIENISWNEIPAHAFDLINTEQVFEHIAEPLDTLCYLKKSLKKNGLIKISVPDGNDIKRRLRIMDWSAPKGSRNSLNPVAPLEHINCFNTNAIIKMAEIAGLEPVYIPIHKQYQYATGWHQTKRILKNILLPVYRNIFRKGTYIFFRNKG
jgi:2-polyprenyl-3-methyl-5-hydroxy-6-metoxy-1,4-benzoquinol methylase